MLKSDLTREGVGWGVNLFVDQGSMTKLGSFLMNKRMYCTLSLLADNKFGSIIINNWSFSINHYIVFVLSLPCMLEGAFINATWPLYGFITPMGVLHGFITSIRRSLPWGPFMALSLLWGPTWIFHCYGANTFFWPGKYSGSWWADIIFWFLISMLL